MFDPVFLLFYSTHLKKIFPFPICLTRIPITHTHVRTHVTTIVFHELTATAVGAAAGELDRWDGGGNPTPTNEENGGAAFGDHGEMEDDEGTEWDGAGVRQQPGGSKIVVASSTVRGRRTARGDIGGGDGSDEPVPNRFRTAAGVGAGNRGRARGSLASRLGPMVGRPTGAGTMDRSRRAGRGRAGEDGDWEEGEAGEAGEEGAIGGVVSGVVVVPEPVPLVEPSKPEVHAAYKDGDTKKRNRRCGAMVVRGGAGLRWRCSG